MSLFLRLLRLFGPQNGWLLLGLGLALLAVAAQGALMLATLGLLGAAAILLGVLRTTLLARPLLRYAERLATHSATFRVLARLRLWLFAQLVPLAPAALGTARSGDVLSRLLNDIDSLDGFYLRLLLPLTLAVLVLTGALAGLYTIAPVAALLVTVLVLTLSLALSALVRLHRPALEQLPPLTGQLRTDVMDGCAGLADLLAAQAADAQLHRISLASANLNRAQLAQARLRAFTLLATGLTAPLILTLLLGLLPGPVGGGLTLLILGGALAVLDVLPGLAGATQQWPVLQAAATRIFALADTPPPVAEPIRPTAVPADPPLRLQHVSLGYGRPRPALDDVSLTLNPGERIWLSGPSGAGKSSLIQLLLKFRTPDSGTLTIGETSLADIHGDDWRTRIGTLSQQTALLAGTVEDNLRLARPDATRAQMEQALQDAGLLDFVRTLPDGLASWVGESGAQFSGGQARRLALAQVLLRDAPIWLLDEPTEGLDSPTAQAVMTALAARSRGKTVLIVSHQAELAQLLKPDRHLRLEAGKLQE